MSEKQLRLYRATPPTTQSPALLRLKLVPPGFSAPAPGDADDPAPAAAASPPPIPIDDQIIAILDASVVPGMTITSAYREKEHALAMLFTTLSVIEARGLHRRLSIPSPSDTLAARFARLVADRQARLLGVLADARRREALGKRSR